MVRRVPNTLPCPWFYCGDGYSAAPGWAGLPVPASLRGHYTGDGRVAGH